jgi:hypothetical protein
MGIKLVPGYSAGTVTAYYVKTSGSSWPKLNFGGWINVFCIDDKGKYCKKDHGDGLEMLSFAGSENFAHEEKMILPKEKLILRYYS